MQFSVGEHGSQWAKAMKRDARVKALPVDVALRNVLLFLQPLVAFLLLVAMPFVTSSFLFLLVRPGAPSSVFAPGSDAREPFHCRTLVQSFQGMEEFLIDLTPTSLQHQWHTSAGKPLCFSSTYEDSCLVFAYLL